MYWLFYSNFNHLSHLALIIQKIATIVCCQHCIMIFSEVLKEFICICWNGLTDVSIRLSTLKGSYFISTIIMNHFFLNRYSSWKMWLRTIFEVDFFSVYSSFRRDVVLKMVSHLLVYNFCSSSRLFVYYIKAIRKKCIRHRNILKVTARKNGIF